MRRVGLFALAASLMGAAGFFACVGDDPGATQPVVDAAAPDGGSAEPDGGDAGPRCDPTKSFGPPRLLMNVNSGTGDDFTGRLSPDEKRLYFASNRNADGRGFEIYVAERASTTDEFGPPTLLTTASTAADDYFPTLSGDELRLYFTTRIAGGPPDIVVSVRNSTNELFGAPVPVGGVVNGPFIDSHPYLLENGAMYYVTQPDAAADASQQIDIVRATIGFDGGFFNARLVEGTSTAAQESSPVVTADERTIYFASIRGGGKGLLDIYVATRPGSSGSFGAAAELVDLDSVADDYPTDISADGCVLYMSSKRNGSLDLFVAEKPR